MLLHGGRFENYYSRSIVTHIICSNLTDAKVKIFQKERCSSSNVATPPCPMVSSFTGLFALEMPLLLQAP